MREPKARLSARDARPQKQRRCLGYRPRVPDPSLVGLSSRPQIEIDSQTAALAYVEM